MSLAVNGAMGFLTASGLALKWVTSTLSSTSVGFM